MKEIDLVNRINQYLNKNGIPYANEIRMGIGIPDIMICSNIQNDHEDITDYYALKLYDYIKRDKIVSLDNIYRKIKLPKSNINKRINVLKEKDMIEVNDMEVIATKNLDLKKIGTNISVEVKVKDWKAGFFQAQRYLCFSDYSYLAVYEKYINCVDCEEIKNTGIGLLSIGEDNIIEVLPPHKSQQCNCYFKYISISSFSKKCSMVSDEKKNMHKIFCTCNV